ncbi:MAG TPA: class I tRNA ligase family protein, partial [Candidatus Paceibacterota bacterium]
CAELGTVLANDEIILDKDGKMVSERGGYPVTRKEMRQWFMRISAYADRLLSGLEEIDWSNSIKEIERNWIGKSEGSEIDFALVAEEGGELGKISVFTTRADTLFGVTYVVLAPEHELVKKISGSVKNLNKVNAYISKVTSLSEQDRTNDEKEKTGIELTGVFAINPANNEKVPVWVADYVLASYGTGAVMAVPAHDERDFEFANKYDLPIKQVVVPEDFFKSIVVAVTLENQSEFKKELQDKKIKFTLAVSSISKREHIRVEFQKDKLEEFISLVQKHIIGNNWVEILGSQNIIVKKDDIYRDFLKESDEWFKKFKQWEPLIKGQKNLWDMLGKNAFLNELICYQNGGKLINSGKFSEVNSEDARKKITEFVKGKLVTKYKMRDAIFARQRYWGEPIPLQYEKSGIIRPLADKDLPLELPKVKSYQPSGNGESPLSGVKSWVKDGYETNTMPGWAGSSWYFLRYMDPANKKELASKDAIDYWQDVDLYVGGSEHATGHLLYARFWHKFLKDIGVVKSEEPFKVLKNQGMILATDGRKMSKRWGNVINPDDVIATHGADTMRVYEAFMGPFESSQPWSTDSIVGSRRFIERVWRLADKVKQQPSKNIVTDEKVLKLLHKTIKKVTEDIQDFAFNTAVSSMMVWLNEAERAEGLSKSDFIKFVQILAPLAPAITEELWEIFDNKGSIHKSVWPEFDPKLIIETELKIAIQVNGKLRAEMVLAPDATEDEAKALALINPNVQKFLAGQNPKKIIFVKGRLINIVV